MTNTPTSGAADLPEPHFGEGRHLGLAFRADAYSVAQVQALFASRGQSPSPQAAQQPAPSPAPACPLQWTPGPNVFKDWCAQWFGPDADDAYLANAVHALPAMAQRFAQPAPTAPTAQADTQPAAYPPLPSTYYLVAGEIRGWDEHQMRAYVDADRAARAPADSVQGFRDGVASLSANAGEPRNAIDRDALIDAIAQGLHGTWHCTRVWEAWHVGTMSQDDFKPVDESETPTEIADAVLALLAAPPAAQAEGWISVDERLPGEQGPADGEKQ